MGVGFGAMFEDGWERREVVGSGQGELQVRVAGDGVVGERGKWWDVESGKWWV